MGEPIYEKFAGLLQAHRIPERAPHVIMPQTPLTLKLGAFVALSTKELSTIADLHRRRRTVPAGRQLSFEGQHGHCAYILASGWACSYKLLPDGERQIVNFQLPGDFLGLRSVLFRASDHSIECLTEVEISEVTPADILSTFEKTPRLATAVLWAMSRDEAMVVEHLVDLGRRSAIQRTAHFLLELGARLRLIGSGDRNGFDCPLSQYQLADALGLSAVHINRVLRTLREAGLLTFQKGHVHFDNLDDLTKLAEFDIGYLDHDGPLLR
jgi:CRP-like cAMP-binding protein